MSTRRIVAIVSIAALSLVAAACGDDPVDGAAGSGAAEETPRSTLPSSDTAPTGSGVLTIAGHDYPFDAQICALTPVSHGGRDYEIFVLGAGDDDGAAYTVEVARNASASGNRIESVNLTPGESLLAAATNVVTSSNPAAFAISSSLLTGTLTFVGTDDVPVGEGTITVTCA